jgi:hypothetical protein
MRFNLRLHGRTAGGVRCQADVSVYANSKTQLQREAKAAAENAPWHALGPDAEWIPDGAHITVERVERLPR